MALFGSWRRPPYLGFHDIYSGAYKIQEQLDGMRSNEHIILVMAMIYCDVFACSEAASNAVFTHVSISLESGVGAQGLYCDRGRIY